MARRKSDLSHRSRRARIARARRSREILISRSLDVERQVKKEKEEMEIDFEGVWNYLPEEDGGEIESAKEEKFEGEKETMEKAKKPFYRYCLVPKCNSTIRSTPDKFFFPVPKDEKLRKQWCKVMRRDEVSPKSSLYCCEDHFNKLKEEWIEMECAEKEELEEDEEEEVKPPVLILVDGGGDNNDECQERNIFDEELKEEGNELDLASKEKFEEVEEEDVKPPLSIIVQSHGDDDNNDKHLERNIFDEDDEIPKVGNLKEQEKDFCPDTACPFSSTFSSQEHNLLPSSLNTSSRSTNIVKITRYGDRTASKKKYECDVCNATFLSPTAVKIHRSKHTGEGPFECDECNASFITSNCLESHKREHSREGHDQLGENLSGGTTNSLKRPRRTQTAHRPHLCDECGAHFVESEDLIIHKKEHKRGKGEFPHHCDECNACFTSLVNLKKHKMLHTGKYCFCCNVCDTSFTTSSHLKNHIRTHTSGGFLGGSSQDLILLKFLQHE